MDKLRNLVKLWRAAALSKSLRHDEAELLETCADSLEAVLNETEADHVSAS